MKGDPISANTSSEKARGALQHSNTPSPDGDPPALREYSRFRLWPRRLGIQLILLFSLMLVGSMATFSYRMLQEVVASNTSSMESQAGVLAKDISATGAELLLERDYSSIEQMLLRAVDFPGVMAIQICDRDGKLIGDVSRSAGLPPEVHYGQRPLTVPAQPRPSRQFKENQMVVWQPILLGDLLGWAKITYSLQDITAAEKHFWLTNGLAGGVIILLTLAGLTMLMRRPIASISRYTQFAGKLNKSHGSTMAVDGSSIELQLLGEALNRASVRLEEQAAAVNDALSDLEELAAFPENNPHIVLSLNTEARVTYLNPEGFRILTSIVPWSGNIAVPVQKIEALLPHDYPMIVDRALADGNITRAVEVQFHGRTWLWTFAPLPHKGIVHAYGLEITKRKNAEEYARNALLEKHTAEAASQAKSAFLANMSHEIRTPLNGVLGFLKLLSRTELSATQREYLHTTEVSARMLLAIINDVLDFSKIEAGKISIEQIEIELRTLLEEIVSLHAVNAEAKNLELALVFASTVPTRLLGDQARITQVVSNLVGNAVKFTQHGEILVMAELLQETDADALIEISVRDTGIGISRESMERLFQPFSQADASTTRKFGGTGLGLVITKTLAELMGGTISVESEEGRGSRFAFTLRLPKQKTVAGSTDRPESMAGLRILTVTPHEGVARSLSEICRSWGAAADAVSSDAAALSTLDHLADGHPGYDALILDDVIDGAAAKSLATHFKAVPGYLDAPVILLGSVARCLRAEDMAGFSACISKPAKRSELQRALTKFLPGAKRIHAVPGPQATKLSPREAGRPARVLIVDDNAINRKLATILVEQLGAEADMAEDGLQAVAACAGNTYDLVLMDAHMPVMDGIEATVRIRESEKDTHRHTPIVALTANAMSGDREHYLAAGMDEYLTKPINETSLTGVLRKLGLIDDVSRDEDGFAAALPPSSDDEPSLPVLDPRMGIELSFGDRETWQTILGMLFEELPTYSATLVAAASAGEMVRLGETAHKLAGASSYCGTPALNHHARQVERLAKEGNLEATTESAGILLRQIERLLALQQEGEAARRVPAIN